MRATLRSKLITEEATDAALMETLKQSTACFNAVCRYGWQAEEHNGVRLHQVTYRPLREQFPDLPSQLVISARMKAAETLKSTKERQKRGYKVSCPQSECCSIRYDARSYWVRLADGVASVAIICGRAGIRFHLPDCYQRYQTWQTCSADLCYDRQKRRFYLHVAVEAEAPVTEASGQVVGCDLGIRCAAVTSKPQFFSSAKVHMQTRQYQHLRAALQSKGTKSAKRHLRKMSRRWYRFQQSENHRIANEILAALSAGDVLIMEDLNGIRNRCKHRKAQRSLFHLWSFAQLQAFLCYKAERKGIFVLKVSPRHSSQTCPKCAHCEKGNRLSQSVFCCRQCGYTANADWVAAQNLRQKGIALLSRLQSDSRSCRLEDFSSDQAQASMVPLEASDTRRVVC